jgi:hypothetical protein
MMMINASILDEKALVPRALDHIATLCGELALTMHHPLLELAYVLLAISQLEGTGTVHLALVELAYNC